MRGRNGDDSRPGPELWEGNGNSEMGIVEWNEQPSCYFVHRRVSSVFLCTAAIYSTDFLLLRCRFFFLLFFFTRDDIIVDHSVHNAPISKIKKKERKKRSEQKRFSGR